MESTGSSKPTFRALHFDTVFIGFVRIADVLTMLLAGLIDASGTTALTQAYPQRLLLLATLAGSIGCSSISAS